MVDANLPKNGLALFKTAVTKWLSDMTNIIKVFGLSLLSLLSQTAFCQNLSTLYQSAQKNNQQWASVQYQYLANRTNYDLAKGDLLPQIGLQGGIKQNHFYPKSDNLANSHTTTTQVGVGLRQALFRTDKVKTLQKAEISQIISDIELLKQQQQLAEQVVKAYFNVLKAQAIHDSLQVEYTALQAQYEMMQARLAQGVVARVDTEESKAQLQSVHAQLANNDVAILNAKQQLSLLTGEVIEQIAPLKTTFNSELVAPKSLENYLNLAKAENFDLLIAQQQVALARANQDYLKSHLFPKVDFVADIGWQDNNHHALAGNRGINYGVGVELELPFYTGGRTLKGLEQGALQTEASISQLKFINQQVLTQTSQAYLNVMAQKATIAAQQSAVHANEQVAKATQTGYDLGVRSMVDNLLAQRQYYTAKRGLIGAYFDYLTAYVDLQRATAGLTDVRIDEINELLLDDNVSQK